LSERAGGWMRGTRWLLLAVLGIAGCGMGTAGAGDELAGTVWRWLALEGAVALEIERPGHYTLEFHGDGRYSARADCNRANGGYTLEQSGLSLGPAATTLAACPPGSHSNRFLRLLGRVSGAQREGSRLVLSLGDGEGSLVFAASRPVVLAGSSWVVRAVNNGKGGVGSVALETALDMSFGDDGRVAGSAGCNRYSGAYTVEGEGLSFGPAAATRRMCAEPERVMEQESEFLAALGTVASWSVQVERLQLRTAEGSLALDLVSAVAGTLSLRDAGTLPSGARVHVALEDVSLADVPAVVIGEASIPLRDPLPPLLFHVAYDPDDIDPRHSYGIRATIEGADGQVLYRTTQAFPVLTRESPTLGVKVTLDPAR
jgi:heat shock protein HslJ